MNISPDNIIYWQSGHFKVNATLVFTWVVMAILFLITWLATRKIHEESLNRWQNFLEVLVANIRNQIKEIVQEKPDRYLEFLGTLFLFISLSNLMTFIPVYSPPTGSLSTTVALALCVFFAVPFFSVLERGVWGYLKHYAEPVPYMIPFNIIGEVSRTIALAVRLFGNVLSGTLIGAILISIVPFFVPVIMDLFGLVIGQIHAYIFVVLAAVYIASATRTRKG